MDQNWFSELADRGVVAVSGEDAGKLLQGIVTNDMDLLADRPALFAGLLSPQGKILFDFFVVKAPDGYLLETGKDKAADLVRRLQLYKLRAKAQLTDVTDKYAVLAVWGSGPRTGESRSAVTFPDPRLATLGLRVLAGREEASRVAAATGATASDPAAYHAFRIGQGVPEGGKDYPFGDTFPHEALLDQLAGVSFGKGCYVGQEIVARMEHRGTARKRIVPLTAASALPETGSPVRAGEVEIGTLGSVAEPDRTRALALVRLDRAAEFAVKGAGLTVGDVPVSIEIPPWATFSLQTRHPANP